MDFRSNIKNVEPMCTVAKGMNGGIRVSLVKSQAVSI